jgi:hypothetical protein
MTASLIHYLYYDGLWCIFDRFVLQWCAYTSHFIMLYILLWCITQSNVTSFRIVLKRLGTKIERHFSILRTGHKLNSFCCHGIKKKNLVADVKCYGNYITTQICSQIQLLKSNHIKSYEVLYTWSDQGSKTDSFGWNRSKQLTLWQQNKIAGVMCRDTEFKWWLHIDYYPYTTFGVTSITLGDRYTC